MFSKNRAALVALGAVLAAAIAGGWAYSTWRTHERERLVLAAVEDTSARMRAALRIAPGERSRGALAELGSHAAALDAHLEAVRAAAPSGASPLVDGAELYVLGAREILRRQIAGIRQAGEAAASRAALAEHMRRAARRDASWIREALGRKKALETEYFEYNLTLGALDELLWSLPDARKRLAPHVEERLLLEVGPAEEAHRRVKREAKRVEEELEKVRRLTPY